MLVASADAPGMPSSSAAALEKRQKGEAEFPSESAEYRHGVRLDHHHAWDFMRSRCGASVRDNLDRARPRGPRD